MADNKRQHFVPKSTLRRFASDLTSPKPRQINLVNIRSGKIVRNAKLKTQCYRDYFYGSDLLVERLLGPVEGAFSALTDTMISTSSISERDGRQIAQMVMLQRGRTWRAASELNEMVERITKLLAYNRIAEEDLRKIGISLKEVGQINVRSTLQVSPLIFDLKQFLIINETDVPFVIGDNPVVLTNWFGRVRFPNRATGLTRSGLQITMPLSPRAALMLHDSNVYSAVSEENVIRISRVDETENLNRLQWLNAFENCYFPPDFEEPSLTSLMTVQRPRGTLTDFNRMHATNDGSFQGSERDEYSPPPSGVTRELVQLSAKSLVSDVRLRAVHIRRSPAVHDDGSLASPQRDKAWTQIVTDFIKALDVGLLTTSDFWEFVRTHQLEPKIGSWLSRGTRNVQRERKARS